MNKKQLLGFFIAVSVTLTMISVFAFGQGIALLDPKGYIALKERLLIQTAAVLALLIITPILITLFLTVYKYREGNPKAKYTPDKKSSLAKQLAWWLIPTTVIFILAVVTWKNTHLLDPYKPLESSIKPVTIQVVALRWKWLFIYPEENIATVNYIQIPTDTPINFELTADAPMNSFWIPRLGGQIYAMTGMTTKTHLIANTPGDYEGSAAEISGEGFAGMRFIVRATSKKAYDAWIGKVKSYGKVLDVSTYEKLSKPSENTPVTYYSSAEKDLYNKIMDKFLIPTGTQYRVDPVNF